MRRPGEKTSPADACGESRVTWPNPSSRSEDPPEGGAELLHRNVVASLFLIAAIALTFLFRAQTRGFLPGHHGYQTALALSMAKNLDARHHFLMFTSTAEV